MKLRKVLFLDFDGVLHSVAGPGPDMRQFVWLPTLMDPIAGHDDLRVVIHASYRKSSPADFLRERLGLSKKLCLGVTNPRLERWASIQDWVKCRPWVESFRVLDDQAYEFPDPAPAELILCDGRRGVSDPAVHAALRKWIERTE